MQPLLRMLMAGLMSGAVACTALPASAQTAPAKTPEPETPAARQARLLSALASSELTAEKAAAFEELAAFGTSEVIPVLAPLLADEQLAHYARFALEANPDPAVDQLLRTSLDQLKGRLLIGVINSIGVRRDGLAVPALATRLTDENVEVAAAAAHALGCMATAAASDALSAALASATGPQRDSVGRGCIVCAERFLEAGSREQAMSLYDLVRAADLAPVIRCAALRGALLARGSDGIPLLVEQLRSDDPTVVETALRAARELPSPAVVPALLGSLGQLPPASVAGVLLALGDLGDAQATSVVTAALAADALPVRLAAIHSLRKIGDASAIPPLWQIAIGPDPQCAESARETIAALRDDKANAAIVARLEHPAAEDRQLALELIAQRRITTAVRQALALAGSSDMATKSAALRALGETVTLEEIPILIKAVITARGDAERAAAQTALTAACVRMPERDACAKILTGQLAGAPDEAKTVLLEQLGAMGGPVALACLATCAQDAHPDTQDAATRILGTWIGADVGPVLLELAQNIDNEKYKIRVLRGYIRIASQFGLPHDEKMDMCTKALAVAQRDDECDLVLNVLAGDPSPIALRIAVTQLGKPALKARAASVAVGIAQTAIQDDPRIVAEAMQQVMDAGIGGDTEGRARDYLQRARNPQ